MSILDEIVAHKKIEIANKKKRTPRFDLSGLSPARDFSAALRGEGISVIAEIKRFSPSKGAMRDEFDPVRIAADYAGNGAAAISVLTDEKYFGGRDEYLRLVREAVELPILRKEFIVDRYQIEEARALGADAILLIAAILDEKRLFSALGQARDAGLSCLVEVHTEDDVHTALWAGADIIGVNNRDLASMKVAVETSLRLRELIPPGIIAVSESGVSTREEVLQLEQAGFDAVLIGGSVMRSPDMAAKLRELLGR